MGDGWTMHGHLIDDRWTIVIVATVAAVAAVGIVDDVVNVGCYHGYPRFIDTIMIITNTMLLLIPLR